MKTRSLCTRLKSLVHFPLLVAFLGTAPNYSEAETYTSQEKAGVAYKLQGEYLGVVEAWGGSWGAQVIAVSEKKLAIHLLDGGLPGQGFKGGSPSKTFEVSIDTAKEAAEVTKDSVVVSVQPKKLEIRDEKGKVLGVMTKIVRESKTLGAKPPEGAIALFDVGRVNDFKGNKMGEDGLLGVGGTSTEVFGDHRMHIEFRTPFQPGDSGQGRGNSGVYIQGRYELQVLDSFGLSGENNECGGIYQIAKPFTNMCYPPLTWQTYDIDFKAATYDNAGKKISNAKLSVKHNGVSIHDGLDLPKGTPGKDPEADSSGPLFLQDHGNPVTFRNIWVQRTSK